MAISNVSGLPYNESNQLMTSETVQTLLDTYGYGYNKINIDLFRNAMVHKSYCLRKNEDSSKGNINCPENCIPLQADSNERMEFLGDAVLNLVIGSYLYDRYYEENEGFLTKMRTKLVNGTMLANLAKKIDIGKYFIISKQIDTNNGRENNKILEDTFEAFIGAMYINCNYRIEHCSNWIINFIECHVDFSNIVVSNDNYKDVFIKYYQQTYGYIPRFYDTNTVMIDNKRIFKICARDNNGNILGTGRGETKKKAENDCAQNILALCNKA